MQKTLRISMIAVCCCYLAAAQPTRLSRTLQNYNEPQKRLLAKNMGRFIFMVFQGQWDLDSSMQYVCHAYGINRQFPYDEMVYDADLQQAVECLDQRAPARVADAAAQASGERKIRLLLELVIYYLYQTGKGSADLDSAEKYLTTARSLATTERWKSELQALQGELLNQQGMMDESENLFAAVDMRIYLPELINYLQDAFETRHKIRFETVVDSIDLDISQAVPIGIIVNETVTNAIKHAFPKEILHPAIIISLSMTDNAQAVLKVADNGVGMPANRQQQGLGLELVYGLAEDLNGTVEITSSKGTTMTIRFTPKRDLSKEYGNRHGNGAPEKVSSLTV